MNENIKSLFEKVQADKELQAKFAEVRTPEEAYQLASSIQGGFTKEELMEAAQQLRSSQGDELSEDDIASVCDLSDSELSQFANGGHKNVDDAICDVLSCLFA